MKTGGAVLIKCQGYTTPEPQDHEHTPGLAGMTRRTLNIHSVNELYDDSAVR